MNSEHRDVEREILTNAGLTHRPQHKRLASVLRQFPVDKLYVKALIRRGRPRGSPAARSAAATFHRLFLRPADLAY